MKSPRLLQDDKLKSPRLLQDDIEKSEDNLVDQKKQPTQHLRLGVIFLLFVLGLVCFGGAFVENTADPKENIGTIIIFTIGTSSILPALYVVTHFLGRIKIFDTLCERTSALFQAIGAIIGILLGLAIIIYLIVALFAHAPWWAAVIILLLIMIVLR